MDEISLNRTEEALRAAGFGSVTMAEDPPDITDEVREAGTMGFSPGEALEIEKQFLTERASAVVAAIRATAPRLSLRTRHWLCSYIARHYPQLGMDFPGIEHLKDAAWSLCVEKIIAKAQRLPQEYKILRSVLGNMLRLSEYPDIVPEEVFFRTLESRQNKI